MLEKENDSSASLSAERSSVHELTHVAHWAIGMTYGVYSANTGQANRLAESYVQAVGWHITIEVYSHVANPRDDSDAMQTLTQIQVTRQKPLRRNFFRIMISK